MVWWLGCELDSQGNGFDFALGVRFFSFLPTPIQTLGINHPLTKWVPRTISAGDNGLEREADLSPPASVKVKNTWSYISTSQYVFGACCLINYVTKNFTLRLLYNISKVKYFVSNSCILNAISTATTNLCDINIRHCGMKYFEECLKNVSKCCSFIHRYIQYVNIFNVTAECTVILINYELHNQFFITQ